MAVELSLQTRSAFYGDLVAAVTLVTWGVSTYTAKAFQGLDQKHSEALTDQFQGEYKQRADEVVNRVQGIADAQATVSMAIDVARNLSDASVYVEDATGLARSLGSRFSTSSPMTVR